MAVLVVLAARVLFPPQDRLDGGCCVSVALSAVELLSLPLTSESTVKYAQERAKRMRSAGGVLLWMAVGETFPPLVYTMEHPSSGRCVPTRAEQLCCPLVRATEKFMSKPSINAKDVLRDLRSGMSHAGLMEKYKLTPKGLESLFNKLVAAGLVKASDVPGGVVSSGKGPESGKSKAPLPPQAPPKKPKAPPPPSDGPPDWAKAIARDMESGLHDNEIMMRHELSPGKFKKIKEEMVQWGLLVPDGPEAGTRKQTKLCPFCNGQVLESDTKCKHCGQWLDALAMAAPRDHDAPVRPHEEITDTLDEDLEDDKECPWEDRESYGTANAYFQTAVKCLITPKQFFSRLPTGDGYLDPILFGIASVVVSVAFAYLWTRLLTSSGLGLFTLLLGMVFAFIGGLIFVPVALFIWSAVLHGCLLLVRGAGAGYQATFRVVSYASVTSVFNAIPLVGSLVALWGIVLTVIGLRETHKTTTGKAVGAVLIPAGVLMLLVVIVGIKAWSVAKTASRPPSLSEEYTGEILPGDLCSAIDEYITQVDSLSDITDAESARIQFQKALGELNKALNQFNDHPDIQHVRQKTTLFGLAVLSESQFKNAFGGKFGRQAAGQAGNLRKDLRKMCGE